MSFRFYKFFLLTLVLAITTQVQAQRYLTPVFSGVSVERDVVYGNNITVLQNPNIIAEDLLMDVYTPTGDTVGTRPVVVYFHTGSFLPPLFNGGITGARTDSTVTEVCRRLARLGYVAIAATYRAGWNPTAVGPTGQDIRTGTLLNAAYRGIQDARTLIRFLRKSVAEESNPYGIDTDRIVLWGQGTGGYISIGSAFLDRFEEVNLAKFIDSQTLTPYVDTNLVGNVFATTQKQLCLPNHVGYSSDFAMAVNMGGALGDSSWIDGGGNEPPTIGFHVIRDPFAPFGNGAVIVPTTGDFVVNVSGTRRVVGRANATGVNDIIDEANGVTDDMFSLNAINSFYAGLTVTLPGDVVSASVDNMYPFNTAGLEAGPWDWWDLQTLRLVVAGTNAIAGTNFNADTLHRDGLLTNPDMSAAKGKAYIDTVMAYYIPRACEVLQLEDCCAALGLNCPTSTNEVIAEEVGLRVMPNPANSYVMFQSDKRPIEGLQLYDMSGRVLRSFNGLNDYQFELIRGDISPGIYIAQLRFGDKIVNKKIVFN